MLFLFKKKNSLFAIVIIQILSNFTVLSSSVLPSFAKETSYDSYDSSDITYSSKENGNKKIRNKQSSSVGRLILSYAPSNQFSSMSNAIQRSGFIEEGINEINKKKLNLPVNIPIVFQDCGQENAFYNPNNNHVIMCYDLYVAIENFFLQRGKSSDEAKAYAISSGVMIFFHEMGHALVDVLDLAITGKEEDTVDDFAATMILDDSNNLPDEILIITGLFFNEAQSNIPFWAEHSLGEQRHYNWVCLLFGKNPQKYAKYAQSQGLGKDRAVRCRSEYEQKISSWERLLAPHSIYDSPNQPSNSNSNDGIKW